MRYLNINKNAILVLIITIELFCIVFFFIQKNNILDKDSLDYKSDMFAIMIEQEDGSYVQDESNTWPTSEDYEFDSKRSGCVDAKDNELKGVLSYNNVKNTVKLKTEDAVFCYIYFSFVIPDIIINNIDYTKLGINKYEKSFDCLNQADLEFDSKYQRIEVSNIKAPTPAECKINFKEKNINYPTLKSKVEVDQNLAKDAPIYSDNITYTKLQKGDYTNITNNSTKPFTWDETNKMWISDTSYKYSSTTSNFTFYPSEDASYQLCYMLNAPTANYTSVIRFNINLSTTSAIQSFSSKSSGGEVVTGCYDIGYLVKSDYVYITGIYYDTTLSFYFQKTDDIESLVDAGYRYSGKQPDNWVWFNNELWRIIGSVPACLNSSCTTKENLVKIMRASSIGGLSFNSTSSSIFEESTIHNLLNDYYLGKKNTTGKDPCYVNINGSHSTATFGSCNYLKTGISNRSTDYYNRMIKDVYWNIGQVSIGSSPLSTIREENNTRTTNPIKIGLASVTDYGFANGIVNINLTALEDFEQYNWIFGQGYERLLSPISTTSTAIILANGNAGSSSAGSAYSIRPTLYLNSNVYVISGDGTMTNPYVLGM